MIFTAITYFISCKLHKTVPKDGFIVQKAAKCYNTTEKEKSHNQMY